MIQYPCGKQGQKPTTRLRSNIIKHLAISRPCDIISRMDGFIGNICELLKDPGVQQAIAGVVVTSIMLCFKRVRDIATGAINKSRRAAAWLIHPDDDPRSSRRKVHSMTTQDINNMLFMQRELAVLQTMAEASRTSIWQFHNGDSFMLANPMFKIKSSLESCKNGIVFDAKVINSVLVSNMLDLVTPVMGATHDVKGCSVVELPGELCSHSHKVFKFTIDEMETSMFKALMTTLGTEVLYALLIHSAKGDALGLLVVQYMSGDNPDSICDKQVLEHMYDVRDKIQLTLAITK